MENQNETVKSKSGDKLALVLASAFLTLTFFLIAPYTVYIIGAEDLPFMFGHFFWIPIVCTVVGFFVLFGIGLLFRGKGRAIFSSLLFGLGLALFLQGNFLSVSIGVLNGTTIDWSKYTADMNTNIFVFCAIVLVPVIVCIFREKIMEKLTKMFSVIITVVQVFLLVMLVFESSSALTGLKMKPSDKDLLKLSKNDNMIVLVLDSFDNYYFTRALADQPDIKTDLDGFTFYSNACSDMASTNYCVNPVIINGTEYKNTGDFPYNKAFFDKLKANNYDLDIYTPPTTMNDELYNELNNNVPYPEFPVDYFEFTATLYKLAGLRYMPDICKPSLWMYPALEFQKSYKLDNTGYSRASALNSVFYDRLIQQKLSTKDKNDYKVYYLEGTHFPFLTDANCKDTDNATIYYETTKGMITLIKEFISQIKELGVYDNTAIAIMADHGWYSQYSNTVPTILFKPKNSRGEMKTSDAPVQSTDILPSFANTMFGDKSFGEALWDHTEGEQRERYKYRHTTFTESGAKCTLVEYAMPYDNSDPKALEPTGFMYDAYGNYRSIYSYRAYTPGTTINCKKDGRYFDLGFEDGETWGEQSQITMTIDTTKLNKDKLTAAIDLSSYEGSPQRLVAEIGGQVLYDGTISGDGTVTFDIPLTCLDNGKMLLKLRYPDAVSKRQLDKNNDSAILRAFYINDLIIN